ncbi:MULTISPECIES: DUF6516 family protein [Rahnella]|uniref:Uncharacterized protein n=1 Tax=Rahnella laticis TaxID=2787622 RepID=A0ABS0E038_9GAMM|nr:MULTISPECIES: DUF6516 family protein [Rahnella]MBF7978473.1 hypothetical protein [Rahnella laticis]MBF7998563.1 hypothetical protein [Rahnella sp. LAC-M12]
MDHGLELLLNLHGVKFTYRNGYWYEIIAYQVAKSLQRPHGIRYSLTLHDRHCQRIFGLDNSHASVSDKSGPGKKKRLEWDHIHPALNLKGTAYQFVNAQQLIDDFFKAVDLILGDFAR